MGKLYGVDLRERAIAVIEGEESVHLAAALFATGITTAGASARLKPSAEDVRAAKCG